MNSVYHAGEIEVQTRAGVREMANRVGNAIHDALLPGAAEFLAEQPMVIVGSTDPEGRVWASVLVGEPGFAYAVDERTVGIQSTPAPGDPLAAVLADGAKDRAARVEVGILVIDLETRERMRLNGPVVVEADGRLLIHTREVYFNCPKYIQRREVKRGDVAASLVRDSHEVTRSEILTPEQRAWIGVADTFFIASAAASGGGADASHRGGNPGFVRVRDAATLEWPDYFGNTMFNTLGNITVNPHAGLLFLDFDCGDTLQVTGQASVIWEPERAAFFPGAERVVEFHVEQVVHIANAVPLRFHFVQYSRFNPA